MKTPFRVMCKIMSTCWLDSLYTKHCAMCTGDSAINKKGHSFFLREAELPVGYSENTVTWTSLDSLILIFHKKCIKMDKVTIFRRKQYIIRTKQVHLDLKCSVRKLDKQFSLPFSYNQLLILCLKDLTNVLYEL